MSISDPLDPKTTYNASAVMAASVSAYAQGPRTAVILSERAEQVASQFAQNAISPFVVAAVLRIIEFLGIMAVGMAVYAAYVVPMDGFKVAYIWPCLLGAMLTIIALQATDSYHVTTMRSLFTTLGRVFLSWSGVFALMTVLAFFAQVSEDYSRIWFGGWYLAGLVLFIITRSVMANLLRLWGRDGRLERRAVIMGGGANAEELIKSLESTGDNDIRICGIFDDRKSDRSPPMVAGYPKLGTIPELVEFGRRARIDMLIVSLPITAESRVLELLKKVWVLPVDIRLSAHTNKLRFRPRSYSYEGAVPFLDVFDRPIADWDSVMKRGFDIFFSVLALVLLSPVMVATAIAIKLDSKGPRHLSPEALRLQQRGHRGAEIPLHVYRYGGRVGQDRGDEERPPCHPRRSFYPSRVDRRIAAAFQRSHQRAIPHRPPPSRGQRPHSEPALGRGGGRLFRASQGQARRHRLGADQRLAR